MCACRACRFGRSREQQGILRGAPQWPRMCPTMSLRAAHHHLLGEDHVSCAARASASRGRAEVLALLCSPLFFLSRSLLPSLTSPLASPLAFPLPLSPVSPPVSAPFPPLLTSPLPETPSNWRPSVSLIDLVSKGSADTHTDNLCSLSVEPKRARGRIAFVVGWDTASGLKRRRFFSRAMLADTCKYAACALVAAAD